MNLRLYLALLLGRASRLFCRLIHRGGTDLPGRIALKVCPDLLRILSKEVKTVAVTGTNGKTTSARMIEQAFINRNLSYLSNRSGANLISGIATEFIMASTRLGKPQKSYAIIECDEAATKQVFSQLLPKVVVVTNLFRDQLDRFGEVTHTLNNIRIAMEGAPDAILCLNADCSLTSSLAAELPNPVIWFGVNPGASPTRPKPELSDALYCIRCKSEYEYDYITYGHLGGFRCPQCGYHRHPADYAVTKILTRRADGSAVEMDLKGDHCVVTINLPAMYNTYNAVGAAAAICEMGLSPEDAVDALGSFQCGFGRMEQFQLGQAGGRMMLVKNPTGCNQVLEYLENIPEHLVLVICLNDRAQDGTDISWIWDVNFELLDQFEDRLERVIVSGDRASDLYVRMKYAGISLDRVELERDYETLVQDLEQEELPVFLMPTYTAMLELRQVVIRHCGGAEFWK